ncbi:L-threonylcarbamoyladenylate synthase [Aureococcus anophagefferens]|uniref:Threonylcarbamoyl-AMP synthase n=1 Tax=Aureococcus anophagefferens TaxID=44056 RepID=A0ABR1GAI9_AURAN
MASLAAPKRLAKVVAPTSAGVEECGRVLASGGLCAFPTETVYGLGANARSTRRRAAHLRGPRGPASASWTSAARAAAHKVFVTLTRAFWPGPLTLVCPARNHLPACLGAGTGPRPALRAHGIESTVCAIAPAPGRDDAVVLTVYRRGAVAATALERASRRSPDAELRAVAGFVVVDSYADDADPADPAAPAAPPAKPECAPGQLLTHYAPKIPAALVSLVAEAGADDAKSDAYVAQDLNQPRELHVYRVAPRLGVPREFPPLTWARASC